MKILGSILVILFIIFFCVQIQSLFIRVVSHSMSTNVFYSARLLKVFYS